MERVLLPAQLPRLLQAVHDALVAHRDEVDALNVFPVPDGDTGTNLAATSQAVVAATAAAGSHPAPGALSRAALRSARGNSGVIFSQILRAVVDAIEAGESTARTDIEVLAKALTRADVLAREAVAEPVEGTILTAVSAAARVAEAAHRGGRDDLAAVLDEVRVAVSAAVADTREQLAVLRDAGVVDAGARGFEVVIVALQSALTGADVRPAALDNIVPRCVAGQAEHLAAFPIEVQFVLEATADQATVVRGQLQALGDSVVVVAAEGLLQAHVHTDDPDAALAVAAAHGAPQDVRVTDLRPPTGGTDQDDQPTLAVVAVLPAGGLADLGEASGAAVVPGAAGALPSVQDLLDAARRTGQDLVVVLPGHPNVVPTARQAMTVARAEGGPELVVIDGAAHPLVVLACLALQTTDQEALADVGSAARCGEVVAAVRDADLPVGKVVAGDPLVVVGTEVVGVGRDVADALVQLLSHLAAPSGELVTIAVGADADLDAGEVMMAAVTGAGAAEIEVLDGGQRPALLLVVVEG